nr:sigma-70 family RNA polymerase sigma factor [Asticcacaulis aquaticus]
MARHVLPHERALRKWLNGRVPPDIDVDDILQETYTRLIMKESVAEILNIRNYVYQVAYSILALHIRRARVVFIDAVSEIEELNVAAIEPSPEDHAGGREELRHLAEAVNRLPGKIREVFLMRRVQEMSQKEVAKTLGLSESTVEKHMSRSLFLLMRTLFDSGKDFERASKRIGMALSRDEPHRGGD